MNGLTRSRGTNSRIGGQKQVEEMEEKEAKLEAHDLLDSSFFPSNVVGGNPSLMYLKAFYCF